jgi:hypothetical protein
MSEPVPSNAEPRGAITFTYTEQDFVAAYQC